MRRIGSALAASAAMILVFSGLAELGQGAGAGTTSTTSVERHFQAFEAAVAQATAKAEQYQYVNQTSPRDRSDAVGYVRQLAQLNLDTQLLAIDPDHPVFFRDPDPFSVPGSNPPVRSGIYDPDNISYIAIVNGSDQYRITGKRGNSDDLSVQAISGFPGAGSTGSPTATLLKNQIAVNSNGTYTITIGGTRPAGVSGNWLPTVPQTTLISVREAFNNWSDAAGDQLRIQTIGQTGPPPATLTNQQLITAIDAATGAVTQQASYWTTLWGSLLSSLPPNQVRAPSPTQGGLAGQLSSLSHFDLTPDQALVVSIGKSDAVYQGFEAADAFAQSLPYATHQSSLNATQAQVSSDGRYWFVVSAKDPGVPNWIDTEGYTQGFLFLRWQELTGAFPPADDPTSQVVALCGGAPRVARRNAAHHAGTTQGGTRRAGHGGSAPSRDGEQSISRRPHRLLTPDRRRGRPRPTARAVRRLHPQVPSLGGTAGRRLFNKAPTGPSRPRCLHSAGVRLRRSCVNLYPLRTLVAGSPGIEPIRAVVAHTDAGHPVPVVQ